jgi:hypothetical protein
MQKWEYRWLTRRRSIETRSPLSGVQISNWDTELDFLNTWGEEGWELVAVLPRSSEWGEAGAGFTTSELWVFKRPVS